MDFFLIIVVESKWKFYCVNWETLLATKNAECETAALQMLNNNYGNEHLQGQKPRQQAQPEWGWCLAHLDPGQHLPVTTLPRWFRR